jgi:hypothetical protein
MRAAIHIGILGVTLALHLACGGGGGGSSGATTPTSEKKEVATGNTLTEFQKRQLLGHYSTEDGASGFILDRTVTPWRAKLDGTGKTVTLKLSNTPRRGESEYKSDDGNIWIRVEDEGGRVLLFQGPKQHQGVPITRDADAEQLK